MAHGNIPVIVDLDIAEFLEEHKIGLHISDNGYVRFCFGRSHPTNYLHHLVVGHPISRDYSVDHRDLDKLNNTRDNLWLTYASINQCNRSNRSPYGPGVRRQNDYFYAKFKNKDVRGRFNCPTAAHLAYIKVGVKTYADYFTELAQIYQRKSTNPRIAERQ